MQWPLVTRKAHEAAVKSLMDSWSKTERERNRAESDAASWRMEYRKIRDRIVDLATNDRATPQIKATLAEFVGYRP